MYTKVLLLVFALCSYVSTMFSQNAESRLLQLDLMTIPIPPVDSTVSSVYLLAKPLRSPQTPGNKCRVGDWVRLDFSKHPGFRVPMASESDGYKYEKIESRFIYKQNPQKQQEYVFYYQGEEGELVSDTVLRAIKFSKSPAVIKTLQPYKLSIPHRGKDLFEVYRYQHPNLHVIVYDDSRKGYYRYRIALVMYKDNNHPEAYVIEQ